MSSGPQIIGLCEWCNGTGDYGDWYCSECGGTGVEWDDDREDGPDDG